MTMATNPRRPSDAPWLCEFLLNEHEGQQLVYRRDPAVRKPLAEVGVIALDGVPILVPEVVLLYKANELTEKEGRSRLPKCSSSLDTEPEGLAVGALDETRPNHPWARRLRG